TSAPVAAKMATPNQSSAMRRDACMVLLVGRGCWEILLLLPARGEKVGMRGGGKRKRWRLRPPLTRIAMVPVRTGRGNLSEFVGSVARYRPATASALTVP